MQERLGCSNVLWKPLDLKYVDTRVDRAFRSRHLLELSQTRHFGAAADVQPALIGHSARMLDVRRQVADFASTNAAVLIVGPTGTGKELVARLIHKYSARSAKPFVALNCAALPSSQLESELFGHVKGAFTGAARDHRGCFEQASGGAIFLDEIGDATLDFQTKLLRILQDGTFVSVGGEVERRTSARVIAATNRDLEAITASGGFRADLLQRLSVGVIHMPSLRDHLEDLGDLVGHFLPRLARKNGLARIPILSDDAMPTLQGYDWPGNVRELEHCLERAVVRARDGVIYSEDIRIGSVVLSYQVAPSHRGIDVHAKSEASGIEQPSLAPNDSHGTFMSLDQAVATHIIEALRRTKGNVNAAARLLKVARGTLRSRMERLSIQNEAL